MDMSLLKNVAKSAQVSPKEQKFMKKKIWASSEIRHPTTFPGKFLVTPLKELV